MLLPAATPANAPPAERRLSPRRVLRAGVAAQVRRFGSRKNLARLGLNVSAGGLRAIVSEPLRVNETVEVFFQAPGSAQLIHTVGHVVWCVPMKLHRSHCCAGIAFEWRLPREDLACLASP